MKINLLKIYLFAILNILLVLTVKSQIYGYGSGFTSDPTPTTSFTLNSVRANVASINCFTPPYTLTHNVATGIFSVGDMILIAQIKGGAEGTLQNVEITGVSGNTLTFSPVPGMTFIWGFSTAGNDEVQIVRIPVYDNFTLSQGMIVKCDPYDPSKGHGGLMGMLVKGSLLLDGGVFSADGAGYDIQGINWGNGGPEAPPTTTNDFNGYQGETYGLYYNGSNCNSIALSSAGKDGGSANNYSLFGTGTTGTRVTHNKSNYPYTLLMGNAGGYRAGSGGGRGSGSGGPGGNGGDVTGYGIGQTGNPGGYGSGGGAAGQGQPGGGAIAIKCGDIQATNWVLASHLITFSADGANGGFGLHGGPGGTGGKGGFGGTGGCDINNVLVPDGGNGGDGAWGMPGTGGDGGNGGDAGYIWISTQSTTLTYTQLSSITHLKGGARGLPGAQGYYELKPATAQHDQKVPNYCLTGEPLCPPPPCIPTSELRCDLDKVMCTLFNARSGYPGTATDDVIFADVNGTVILEYTASDGRLACLVPDLINCKNYYYFTHFNNAGGYGEATNFMKYFAQILTHPIARQDVDLSKTIAPIDCNTGYVFRYRDLTTAYIYDRAGKYIVDAYGFAKSIRLLPCPGISYNSSGSSTFIGYTYANWGDPGDDGDKQNQPNSNLVLDVPCPYKIKLNQENPLEAIGNTSPNINLVPNTGVFLSTESISSQNPKYRIYDISGRLIANGNIHLDAGLNNVNVPIDNLQKGIFIIEIEFENGQRAVQKIVN